MDTPSSALAPGRAPLHPDQLGIGRLFDTVRDAVVVADAETGRIVLWNPPAARLFGYSEREALTLTLEQLVPDRLRHAIEQLRVAGEGTLVDAGEVLRIPALTRSGQEVAVEMTLSPLGSPPRRLAMAILRDVTGRDRAEAETKAAFSVLSATLESTTEGVLVIDTKGRIVCFNQRLVRIWGVPSSMVASADPARTMAFLVEKLQAPDRFLARLREFQERPDAETTDVLELRDGRVVEVASQPQRIDGQLAGRVWCFRDVTQARRAEERLRTTELQYRTLIEGVQAIVWSGDAETLQPRFVSKEAEALLGVPPERWTEPRFWEEHLHPDDRAWALEGLRAAIASGRSHAVEYRMLAADGRVVWLRNIVRVARDAGGRAEVFGVMVDVTERRAAEEAQQAALERLLQIQELKEANQAKAELLRTAGHELNTPLSTVHSLLSLLKGGELGPLNEEQGRAVAMLHRNVERLARLVRDVLETARLQSGRLALRPRPHDVAEVVDEAVASFREQARQAGVTLEASVRPGLRVVGDPERLTQVLFNLLGNALKFTPQGGRVVVTAGPEDGRAVVRVQDSGIGLDAEQVGRLFQPFARVHGDARPGNGLGLYISKSIVAQHGGQLWAESDGPGRGATFVVALPLAALEAR